MARHLGSHRRPKASVACWLPGSQLACRTTTLPTGYRGIAVKPVRGWWEAARAARHHPRDRRPCRRNGFVLRDL